MMATAAALDRELVLRQAGDRSAAAGSTRVTPSSDACPHTAPRACPPACLQGLMHMARTEGMRGMMKGNWTNCVRIIPNSAMKFFTYEQLSRWVCGSALGHSPCSDTQHRPLASNQQQSTMRCCFKCCLSVCMCVMPMV